MKLRWHLILIVFFGLGSCTNEPGEGGTASIKGKVVVHQYCCAWSQKINEWPAQEEDVYIVYGDNEFYGNDIKTHYDGTFKFSFLRKGIYTIYSYSKDSSEAPSPSGNIAVKRTVEITDKNQELDIGEIIILDK